MRELDVLKDILQYRTENQKFYNECLISVRNPEVRKLFTQLRDDEMRDVANLQQKVERLETGPRIISKLFSSKDRY